MAKTKYATEHLPLFDDHLRPYQKEFILAIRESFRKGHRRVLGVLPTGMGKTRAFTILPREGARVMVVCPQIELVGQTARTISSLRRRAASIEQAWQKADAGDEWVVACYASLATNNRYRRFVGNLDLVIVDEADEKFSIAFRDMMNEFVEGGARVLGVTATPYRGDKSSLFGFYEDCPYSLELRDALDGGWLVKPKVFVHKVRSVDFSKLTKTKVDFKPEELDALLTSEQCLHDIAALVNQHHKGQFGVVFCNSVLQAKLLRDLLVTRHGQKVSCVWGTQNPEERAEQIKKFESGENTLVTNCNVLGRGWDCPEVREIFNARPTKSKNRYVQVLGRGTRTVDNCLKNDMNQEERLKAIAESRKPSWVIHDITNTCRFHEPVTAIDILMAGDKTIIDKVKAGAEDEEKGIEDLDADMAEAIRDHQEAERLAREEEKKRRQGIVVGVTFDSRERNLFDRADAKKPGVRTYRFLFGRWKGYPLNSPDVPDHYIRWAVENARLTVFWSQIYRQELERREACADAKNNQPIY